MRQSQQFNTTAQWTTACVATRYVLRELDEELSGCSPSRLSAMQAKEWSFHFNDKKYSKMYLVMGAAVVG